MFTVTRMLSLNFSIGRNTIHMCNYSMILRLQPIGWLVGQHHGKGKIEKLVIRTFGKNCVDISLKMGKGSDNSCLSCVEMHFKEF